MSDETKAMLNTLWKTFVVALIAQFVALGGNIFSLDLDNAKTILGAAVAAAVMFLYNYLSKGFPLYGAGKVVPDPVGGHEAPVDPAPVDPAPAQPVDPPVDNAPQDPPAGP